MSKPSSILFLPTTVQSQINTHLRARLYGGIDDLLATLNSDGHAVSRSMIGRYAISLKLSDASGGDAIAQMLMVKRPNKATASAAERMQAVAAELITLQERQVALMAEFANLAADCVKPGRRRQYSSF